MKKLKGFTIIEMLIVVAIAGILLSLVMGAVEQNKAIDARQSDEVNVQYQDAEVK